MKRRIRTGDQVVVIAGNDRGKEGKILLFKGDRVIVEGVNVRKKCVKKSQNAPKGQIIDIECAIDISNVMLKDMKEKDQKEVGPKKAVAAKKKAPVKKEAVAKKGAKKKVEG